MSSVRIVAAILMQAGYRGQGPYVAFLFFRMIVPLVMLLGSLIYVFLLAKFDTAPSIKIGELTAIAGALKTGEKAIIKPAADLQTGTPVRVVAK